MMSALETECSAVSFDVWIKTLEPLCVSDGRLILVAANENHKENVNSRLKITIKQVLKTIESLISDVIVVCPDEKDLYAADKEMPVDFDAGIELSAPNEIIKKYNFENYVVGKCNEYAVAAAKAISDEPGTKYNPLFLYGGVGLGKTHIMHAIGNSLMVSRPSLKVVYVSSEKFLTDFINSIPTGKGNKEVAKSFRDKYRKADVLMIDDVQFIAGKQATVEELFHTFNELHDSGKQLIFTSDRSPAEIRDIEERLRSRFGWGLIIDIQPPDVETRIAILRKKSQSLGVNISMDVLASMAEAIESNIRDMESLLNKVIFLSGLINRPPSVDLVREALKDYRNVTEEKIPTDRIIDCVCQYFKMPKGDLLGKKKNKEIVEPRQLCMYLMTEYTNLPLGNIGDVCGGRDHTTVMHARDKIDKMLVSVPRIQTAAEDIRCLILKK